MKWLWLLLLPVVWVPLIAFLGMVGPSVPVWAWVFGVVFWVLLLRRRRASAGLGESAGGGTVDTSGPMWSPTRGGGLL